MELLTIIFVADILMVINGVKCGRFRFLKESEWFSFGFCNSFGVFYLVEAESPIFCP